MLATGIPSIEAKAHRGAGEIENLSDELEKLTNGIEALNNMYLQSEANCEQLLSDTDLFVKNIDEIIAKKEENNPKVLKSMMEKLNDMKYSAAEQIVSLKHQIKTIENVLEIYDVKDAKIINKKLGHILPQNTENIYQTQRVVDQIIGLVHLKDRCLMVLKKIEKARDFYDYITNDNGPLMGEDVHIRFG